MGADLCSANPALYSSMQVKLSRDVLLDCLDSILCVSCVVVFTSSCKPEADLYAVFLSLAGVLSLPCTREQDSVLSAVLQVQLRMSQHLKSKQQGW